MHLDPFELHRPATVEETVALARELAGRFDYLAGGTDLLANYKMHLNAKPHLIALDRLAPLRERRLDRIGAMVRLAELERDGAIRSAYPALAEAVDQVATPLVRASATVGGNLLVDTRCFFFNQSYFWRASLGFCLKADGDRCHVVPQKERCYATFSGDLAPALLVLDAEVEIVGPDGRRRIPLASLYDEGGDGIRRHRLAPGEFLAAVTLPEAARRRSSTYAKLRVRPSFDFPELGVAVACRWAGDRLEHLAVATGGLETYPRRWDDVTAPFVGRRASSELFREVGAAIRPRVRPVHNTFLPPDYRKQMTELFVRRALERLAPTSGAAG